MRPKIKFAIRMIVLAACLVWLGKMYSDYQNDVRIAKKLESLGVKIIWKHLHVRLARIENLEPGEKFSSICNYLEQLNRIDNLHFNYCSITDTDLQHLSRIKNVEWLSFFEVKINGPGLKHLTGMHDDLKRLNLSDIRLNDETIENVTLFTDLRYLEINNTDVTSEGISKLKPLSQLSTLDLNSYQTEGEDGEYLPNAKINDQIMPTLTQMQTLRDLRLDSNEITDTSINHLAQLKNLRWLWIQNTHITREGYQTLLKEIPKTNIIWTGTTVTKNRTEKETANFENERE